MANDNGAPGDFSGVTYLGDPNEQGSNSYHIKRASGKVLGPFDAELIIQMIEGSKLSGDEGVSVDRESWVPIMAVSRFAEAFRHQGGTNATLYGVQRVGLPGELTGDEPTLMSDRSSLGLDGDSGFDAFSGSDSGAPPVPESLAASGLGVTEDSGMNLASGNWASLDEGADLPAREALSSVAGLRRMGTGDASAVGEPVTHSTTELPTPRGFTNFPGQNDGLPAFPSPDELAASLDFASASQPSVSAADAPEPSRAFESPPEENPRTMAFSRSDLPVDRESRDLPVSAGVADLPVSSGADLPVSAGTNLPRSAGADLPVSAGTNLPRSAEADLPVSAGVDLPVSAGTDLPASTEAEQSIPLPASAGPPEVPGTQAMSAFSAPPPSRANATRAMGDSGSTLTPPSEPGPSAFGTMAMSGLSDAELPASIESFDPLAAASEQAGAELPTSSRAMGSSLLDDVADADDLWAAPDTMVSPSDAPDAGRSFGARPAPPAPSFQTEEVGFDISGAAPAAGSDFDEFFPSDDGSASAAPPAMPTPLDEAAAAGTVEPAKKSAGKGGGGTAIKVVGGLAALGLVAGLGYMFLSSRSAEEPIEPETAEVVPERVARVVELDDISVLQADDFGAMLLFVGDARTALEQGGGAEERAKLVLAAALLRIEHPNAGGDVGDLNSEVQRLRAEETPSDLVSLAIGAWEASEGDSAAVDTLSGLSSGEYGGWANLFAGLMHVQQHRGVFPQPEADEPVAQEEAAAVEGEGSGSGDSAAEGEAVAEAPAVDEAPAVPELERPSVLSPDAARAFAAARTADDTLVAARYWSGVSALAERDPEAASVFFAEALALNDAHVPSQVGEARALLSQAKLGDADARIQEVIDQMGDDASAESRSDAYLVAAEISIARLQPQVAIESLLSALEADPNNATALESLGVQFARAGQHGRAMDYFSGNPDLPEGHPAVSLGLGRAQMGAELLDEAKATVEAGADAHPRDTRFALLLGQVYEARAEFDLARQYYRQALQIDPEMAGATVALGRLLERENRVGEALVLLEEASLQSGDNAATVNSIGEMYLRMGQPNLAVDAFQKALERDNSFPDARINLTEYYLNTGQQTRAIEYIDQMVAAGIDSPRVRFLNARALHGQGRFEQGTALMLELLEDEPDNTTYLMQLGELQFDAGNYYQARARFSRAADLQPSLLDATYMMGRSDMKLEDMDGAIAALTTVAQRSSDGNYHFWLGQALDGARQQVPALDAYTRAIDEDVSWALQNPSVYHERGKLFFQRGRTTAAYWDLRTALTLDPRRADTHWLLGQVYFEQRDYDTAITSYNRALALEPGRWSIEYQIGLCHLRAEPQRLTDAIAALERAREGGYGSVRPDLFQRLAYAYRDLGRNGEAADNLERFLEHADIPYDETLETRNEIRRLRGSR